MTNSFPTRRHSDLNALVAVLHLEEHAEIEIDVARPAAEEDLLLRSLCPVQIEDDLAERVTGVLEADARARFFERDLLQAHGGRRRRRRRRRGCRRGSRSGCRSRSGRWCWRICDFAAEVGDQTGKASGEALCDRAATPA